MLARSVLRMSRKRAFGPLILSTSISRAKIHGTANFNDPAVSVISYRDGGRIKQDIGVKTESKAIVNRPGRDQEHAAEPLNLKIYPQLTPTLRKFTLPNKVAVVTGAGRGLGLNMARGLAEVGVRGIAILDVQKEIGEQAAHDLAEQTGVDVRFYCVDVRDGDAVGQIIQDVVAHYGDLNILINAAGIADSNIKAETYDHAKWRRQPDINVTGTFITSQACAQQMIKSKQGGNIINIASMSGSIVNYPQEQSCYNASKAAVIQLTKSLAAEWAQHGIRVNSISPGYMDTALNRVSGLESQKITWINKTPQQRLGAIDELNNLAVYLASNGSSFMTGNNCVIDGGYTLW